MKIHTEITKDQEEERTYQLQIVLPKTDVPRVPGDQSNTDVGEALKYFEDVILNHDWTEEMGYEEKVEVLRQYSLYWFLKNILQVNLYPLPKNGDSESPSN